MSGASGVDPIRCWEWRGCDRKECKAYQSRDLRCWLIPHASCFDGSTEVAERLLSECSTCPVYDANRVRAGGKRHADRAILDTVDALLAEARERAAVAEKVEAESRIKSAQVKLLSEVGRALQRTMELEDILLVILTAVTAGDGLGLNRAFLLLVDETGSSVTSRMAVGPAHALDAERIWKTMDEEDRSLGEMLSRVSAAGRRGDEGVTKLAEKLVIPLSGKANVIARSLEECTSRVVRGGYDLAEARQIAELLKNDQFLVVPLVAERKRLGAILADNFVTGRPIVEEDVRLLETFASQAALAILNASLHRKLRARVVELERAHEELTQNQLQLLRAERLLAAGGLAATLIHDLKAPVVSVGLMAKAAASGLVGGPVKDTLEGIGQEILRIEDYLRSFAKSAGKGTAETAEISVSHLVKESLGALRAVMAKGGIECELALDHGDHKVVANKSELRQVLVNLLYNSVEAMPEGGKITVSTGIEKSMVRIAVRDTGKGISEELKARVFSPFFTTKAEGSGLGLVIVKRTVTNYGGRISLESTEGLGTCFTIYLPVAK